MDVNLQPELSGELIAIRQLRPDDFEALFQAASDPLIWEQHPEPDRYERDVFQRFFDSGLASGGAFVITDRATGQIIGSSRYYDYQHEQREIKIGFTFLRREYWGGPYNRELKTIMLDHAFQFVDRVLFEVGENNLRSQKALQNIGAHYLTKAATTAFDGSTKVNHVYVLTKRSGGR